MRAQVRGVVFRISFHLMTGDFLYVLFEGLRDIELCDGLVTLTVW